MELDDLYVLSEYRGQGVGTAIIQKCCCETELPVFLYVFKENNPAVSLYEKMGFRITGVKPNAIRLKNGRLLNEYMMVKTLEREKE